MSGFFSFERCTVQTLGGRQVFLLWVVLSRLIVIRNEQGDSARVGRVEGIEQ